MSAYEGLRNVTPPDCQGLIDNILRKSTPRRVYHAELFHDVEIREALARRFGLWDGITDEDPDALFYRRVIAVNRFCGLDYIQGWLVDIAWPMRNAKVDDSAGLKRDGGRSFRDEHTGPVTNWKEFEEYPWPDARKPVAMRSIEWLNRNTPEGMGISCATGHFCEYLCWMMGYETLCYALHENRDLVKAIAAKILDFHVEEVKRYLEFDRVRIIWGSDDMGFKTGLLFSPADMREFVLAGHKRLAALAHAAGRVYLLHSCGRLTDIIHDLTDDVRIDGKHSFEDTIEDVRAVKGTYGRKIALIGGIDVDFLCRSDERAIRRRVRETLDVCLPGGGYCLGTGNSVANYIPVDNYLAMVDEGWLYGR